MSRWTMAPAAVQVAPVQHLLLVVLALAAFVPAQGVPDRHDFVHGPVPVTKSGVRTWADTYASIYQAWPRFTKSGSAAPKLNAVALNATINVYHSKDIANDQGTNYVAGVFSIPGSIFIIGVVTLVCFILFCFCRFCCNCCGRRRRTKQYSAVTVWTMRTLMLVYFLILCGVVLIAYNGIVGTTFTIDDMQQAVHADINHFLDVKHIIDGAAGFVHGFIPIMSHLNKTIFDVIPTGAALDRHIQCIDNVVSIGDNAKLVRSDLQSLDRVVRSLPDMSGLNRTLGDLDVSVHLLPDLNGLADRIAFLNASIGAMPALQPISDDLTSMNATMQSLKGTVGPVNSQIQGLRSTLSQFTTQPLTDKLAGFDAFWGNLPDLNLLKSDVNVADGAAFRNINETYASLVQMQSAVNGIPSIGGFIADLRNLNATKNQLASALILIDLIKSLNASLKAIPDLNRIMTSMKRFKTFLTTDYHLDIIKSNVRSANLSIATQPSPLKLLKYMTDMKASVGQIKAVDFGEMIGTIQTFNRTIGGINCVSALMDMIININTSLVILPPSISKVTDMWDQIQPQIANISSQQANLQEGVDSIQKMNSSLDNLPNFDDIISKIKQMNSSSGSLPNLSKVYDQITDLNKTLHDVPDMDTYINNTAKLNSSLKVANLDSTVSSLQTMNSQLHSMPPLQPHIDNMVKLNDTLAVLKPALSSVLTLLSPRPTHAPNGYSAVASGLVSGITQLQSTNNTRPDNSALISNMNQLNHTVATMPDLSSTQTSISNLNGSLTSFPNVASLKAKIGSLQTSLNTQPDFNALIKQLRDLNRTVLALPNLPSTQAQVLDVKKSADSANINGTIKQLNQVADISLDKSATSQLDQIKNMTAQLDMGKYVDMVDSAADNITNYNKDVNDTKATYNQKVDDNVNQYSGLDSFRILGMTGLMLIPVVVALLGLGSVVCRCGCGAMCMALIFIYMSFFYYILAALFAAPSVFVSDFCEAADELAINANQISGASILNQNLSSLLGPNMTSYIPSKDQHVLADPLSVYVTYYFVCPTDGYIPALLQELPNVALDAIHDKVNISSVINTVETSANVKFVPKVRSIFDDARVHLDSSRDVFVDVQQYLFCDNVTPYLRATLDVICVDAKNGLVIFSFSLFLLALLMSIGVCCGILGFKRLQRQNRVQDQPGDDDDDLEAQGGAGALAVPAMSMAGQSVAFGRPFAPVGGGGATSTPSPNQK